jgi:hypothetical protein
VPTAGSDRGDLADVGEVVAQVGCLDLGAYRRISPMSARWRHRSAYSGLVPTAVSIEVISPMS